MSVVSASLLKHVVVMNPEYSFKKPLGDATMLGYKPFLQTRFCKTLADQNQLVQIFAAMRAMRAFFFLFAGWWMSSQSLIGAVVNVM